MSKKDHSWCLVLVIWGEKYSDKFVDTLVKSVKQRFIVQQGFNSGMHQGQGLHGLSVAVPELAIQGGLSNEGPKPLWNIPLVAKAAVGSAKNIAGEL